MEAILLWLLVQMITKASEKWNISQTWLSIWLAIVLWAWYYVASNYYAVEWQQLVERAWWVYASSQVFYNVFKKAWLLDKKGQ
jgi:hypothetical protein